MLDRPTPAAPGLRQDGKPEPGTSGCEPHSARTYVCNIAHEAPIYPAETTKRSGRVPAGPYVFLCQSAGPKYAVGNRANYWWAWVRVPVVGLWMWVPVVFLTGGPDNGPEPGLPVCGRAPTSTTEPSPASTGGASPTMTKKQPRATTKSAPPTS